MEVELKETKEDKRERRKLKNEQKRIRKEEKRKRKEERKKQRTENPIQESVVEHGIDAVAISNSRADQTSENLPACLNPDNVDTKQKTERKIEDEVTETKAEKRERKKLRKEQKELRKEHKRIRKEEKRRIKEERKKLKTENPRVGREIEPENVAVEKPNSKINGTSENLPSRFNADSNTELQTFNGPPIYFIRKFEVTVSLLPTPSQNIMRGIAESLFKFLFRYSDSFAGVLLAFNDIEVRAEDMNKHALSHEYDVVANFLIFCPSVGCTLRGTVMESSVGKYVILKVLAKFEAVIKANEMEKAGFDFDETQERWRTREGSKQLLLTDKVEFLCDAIHEAGGLISFVGLKPRLLRLNS